MPAASRLGGILLSALCHGLILLIPMTWASKAPQAFPPVEFVMTLAEKPMASEPPPRAAEPPKPEPVRPKAKIKPRPQPKPVVTEPVETKVCIPQPPAPKSSPAPRRVAGLGTGSAGPLLADFGSTTGPAFLRRVAPLYPDQARRRGLEGRVVLRLVLDERGNLLKVEVVQAAGHGFEEAAVDAVKRSSFRPAMINGQAVGCIARLPIRFALRN